MADNGKYYYLKVKENFFETDEMKILEGMKDGYIYGNILLKLYLRSLKNEGRLMYRNRIPYTPEILAELVGHEVGTVEKALKIFRELDLIEVLDNGAIYMMDIQNFIGRAINGEVMDQVKSLTDKVEHMKKDLSDARKADERRDIEQRRVRILRFGEELLRNIKHTKEHFDQILIDITVYEKYCKEHPEFENDVTVETISHIKNVYQQCWKEHSFL